MAVFSLKKCLSEPKRILKLIVLLICLGVATYQLTECFKKIIHPPISTYYSFQLNESMQYPSVTICRNPGYKTELFPKYGFIDNTITYSSNWRYFNYSAYTISDFFEETTYSADEVLAIMAFEGFDRTNVDVKEVFLLNFGRCFTVNAKIQSKTFSEAGGYIFYFRHTDTEKFRNFFGISLSGFHIFIHDPTEILTASDQQDLSYMEYLYLEIGEDLRVNLRVQKFNQINAHDYYCSSEEGYSISKCNEQCLFQQITDIVNCTAPWINIDGINKPECDSYDSVRLLRLYYTDSYRERYLQPCHCPTKCNISIYQTFVQSRKEVSMPDSNLSVYFSSNIVSIMDEVFGYDWNAFLADIGGSLGFLLGISVIGLISLIEHIIIMLFCNDSVSTEGNEDEVNNTREQNQNGNLPKIIVEARENDLSHEKNCKGVSDGCQDKLSINDKNSINSYKY